MKRVVAELGPTNTGKTHRAIERMLEHESGMMGLPLRLLAREVYDRVAARVGEGRVALVTGEEKRIPPHPAYWICTVEAMPVNRRVAFLAVDEIQLSAHRERGHIFTDRLLHARGLQETWFMGAQTMRTLLKTFVPEAQLQRSERFSQLRYFGRKSLKSLSPRTAVVAFSTDQVYEIAESLRRLRGGVAIVLGALSPRTRNAQVALYQSGEVQYLVATDAIGMGLNLDLHHVAFASRSKFDGAEQRELQPDELAQIAGRAGRHLNEGSFGVLTSLPDLAPRVVSAIENHRFDAVERLVWRNPALDFSSGRALLDSLAQPPPHAALVRVERADDFESLKQMLRFDEVQSATSERAGLERLWEVCQIPDFRKRLFSQHVALLREIHAQLMVRDALEPEWLEAQVAPLQTTEGDIHPLMDRLAAIRIWSYVSHRPGWVPQAVPWQERIRQVEDHLGDVLHQRLVERFVEKSARKTRRRVRSLSSETVPVVTSTHPFAKLKSVLEANAENAHASMTEEAFVHQVVDAKADDFAVDLAGRISFDGEPLGRLVHGKDVRTPLIALIEPDLWTGGARRQLEQRLIAHSRDVVTQAMGGLPSDSWLGTERSAPVRGFSYRLVEGLGVARREDALEQWQLLDETAKQRLSAWGTREGKRFFFVEKALTLPALQHRCMLTALFEQEDPPEGAPLEPVLAWAKLEGRHALWLGYERLGGLAVRIDLVEKFCEKWLGPRGQQEVLTLCRQWGLSRSFSSAVVRDLSGWFPKRPARPPHRRRSPGGHPFRRKR